MIPTSINPLGLEHRTLTFYAGADVVAQASNPLYCLARFPAQVQQEYGREWSIVPTTTQEEWDALPKYVSAENEGGSRLMVMGDVSLYSGLVGADDYIVTFNPNGGNVGETSRQVVVGSPYGSPENPLPVPTRSGYSFSGWYTSASGGTRIADSTVVSIVGNHVLYAHWSATSWSVPSSTLQNINMVIPNSGVFSNAETMFKNKVRGSYNLLLKKMTISNPGTTNQKSISVLVYVQDANYPDNINRRTYFSIGSSPSTTSPYYAASSSDVRAVPYQVSGTTKSSFGAILNSKSSITPNQIQVFNLRFPYAKNHVCLALYTSFQSDTWYNKGFAKFDSTGAGITLTKV